MWRVHRPMPHSVSPIVVELQPDATRQATRRSENATRPWPAKSEGEEQCAVDRNLHEPLAVYKDGTHRQFIVTSPLSAVKNPGLDPVNILMRSVPVRYNPSIRIWNFI